MIERWHNHIPFQTDGINCCLNTGEEYPIKKYDLHTHTTYSDGENTPEQMILAAKNQGFDCIGISDHSYTIFDESYCMKKENISGYIKEINELKEKYAGEIQVFCGIEQDYYSDEPTDAYDYVIGSVHYIKVQEEYIPVDESVEILKSATDKYFDGDIYVLVEKYFETVADVVRKTNADIVGHFDLITKFQEKTPLFDEANPRYVKAWKNAADNLLKTGKPFEINTGAISRGYRTTPYPKEQIRAYVIAQGGSFIISSDSHNLNRRYTIVPKNNF